MADDAGQLVRAVDRLADHVGHWTASRWTAERAQAVHALAQRLADLEARVTGRAPRPVPRLSNDLALPDQVRVTALDLVAASPPPDVLQTALDAVAETRRLL